MDLASGTGSLRQAWALRLGSGKFCPTPCTFQWTAELRMVAAPPLYRPVYLPSLAANRRRQLAAAA